MTARSAKREVRNPILGLPQVKAIQALPPEQREPLRRLLIDLALESQIKAEKSWRTRKAPMAAYWKAVAVYSKHIARALK